MSDNIPFEIQSEIIKKLPIKSILQFRSVSKQWKSLIDSPEFIKTYPNPSKHHLLVWSEIDNVRTYTSIIDDNTFPHQKSPLTAPKPLNLLKYTLTLGSVNGIICFCGRYQYRTNMAVLWNPSLRKYVGIVIPNVSSFTVIGFGVCSDTSDPKLVAIDDFKTKTPGICWEVRVFSLSSRVWKTVYVSALFKSCALWFDHVCIDGIIYWRTLSSIVSFDLKSEKLGEVRLPERLVGNKAVSVTKMNESLSLLEYSKEGEMRVCGVWMRKDGVDQPFTKIYTIKVEGRPVYIGSVLGFRNNGEVVLNMLDLGSVLGFRNNGEVLNMLDLANKKCTLEVYEPSSGHTNGLGIEGGNIKFFATSYMETLLLLDESNYIIH